MYSGETTEILGGKVVKSDKSMAVSQLLGGTYPGFPTKVYAFNFDPLYLNNFVTHLGTP